MATVSYDGYKIIPAPLVSINKDYDLTEDGTKIGATFTLSLRGEIVAFKGSPRSTIDGTMPGAGWAGPDNMFWNISNYPPDETIPANSRLRAITLKQEALRELFSTEGKSLEFQSADGGTPLKCNPRFINIALDEGVWYDRCPYTATFEVPYLLGGMTTTPEDDFVEFISQASENWQLETNEDQPESQDLPRSYRMTHNVTARGKRVFDDEGALIMPAWEQARNWVFPRLGFDAAYLNSSGVRDMYSSLGHYNFIRSENIDELGGGYDVSESWVIASGAALEDFSISTRTSAEDSLTYVSIEGNITGLEERDANLDVVSTKYANATAKYNIVDGQLFTRAQTFSGIGLNLSPLNKTVGRNPITGTINYNTEYNNRPSVCVSGALSEVISLQDTSTGFSSLLGFTKGAIFATIPILGRGNGPLLQNIDTTSENRRSLSIEVVMPVSETPVSGCGVAAWYSKLVTQKPSNYQPTATTLANIIQGADPSLDGYATVYASPLQENWSPTTGRYSCNIEWIYNND